MATVQDLTAGIMADAQAQALHTELEMQEELAKIAQETENLLTKKREQLYAQTKKQEEELKARMEARRQLESNQKKLAAKQAVIDEVFAAAREELAKMPATKRRKLLQTLWDKVKKQITVGSVIAAKKDAAFFKGKARCTSAEGLGGFVANSKDGNVSIDCRFETLLADARAKKMAEIAQVLFA